jgi:hypothetical protein
MGVLALGRDFAAFGDVLRFLSCSIKAGFWKRRGWGVSILTSETGGYAGSTWNLFSGLEHG